MIIRSIKARNFMRYPEIELKGFPERGVIGIFGNNECGKSTIGHVISFALFGATVKATKGEKEQIIQWGESSCEVELEFSLRDQEYRVYRKIRQTGAPIARFENLSKGKTVATGVHDVDNAIHDLLTFDFKGFRYSTYVGQKELDLILDSSKIKDRRSVIHNMLGIDVMEKARSEIPAKIKSLESELDNIDTEKNSVESTVKELMEKQQRSDVIKAELKRFEDEKKTKSEELEKEEDHLKALQKCNDISTKISSKNEIIAGKVSEANEVEKTLSDIQESKTKLQRLEKDVEKYAAVDSDLETKKELRKQFISFKNELDGLKDAVNEHKSEVSSQISRLKQHEQELNDRREAIDRDIAEEESIRVDENEIKSLGAQKNRVDKNMRALAICAIVLLGALFIMLATDVPSWPLPLVLVVITAIGTYYQFTKSKGLARSLEKFEKNRLRLEQKDEHLARYSNEKLQIAERIATVSDQLSQLVKVSQALAQLSFDSFTDLNKDLKLLERENLGQLSDISNTLSLIVSKNYPFINIEQRIGDYGSKLDDDIDALSSMARERTRLESDIKNCRELIKKEQEMLNRRSQLNQEIREQQDMVAKLQAELPLVEYSEVEYKRTEKSCSDLEERVRELGSELGNAAGQLKTLEGDVSRLPQVQERLKELERDHAAKYREIQVYHVLNDAFRRSLQEIRKRLGPNIEMYFSWILPKITNNRYQKVRVSEDFDIDVFSLEKNGFVSSSDLSGGTEDQLLLSLRLAFAKALTPEGAQFFLFLDEPLSSFDEQRRASFLDFLKLLETSFQQIFLISHLTGLEDFVDNFIRIENTAEGVPQVLCSWD